MVRFGEADPTHDRTVVAYRSTELTPDVELNANLAALAQKFGRESLSKVC